jgi:hypothetical protein
LNESIEKKLFRLNAIIREESRAKSLIQVLDKEKQLFDSMKDQLMEDYFNFKQSLGS